MITECCFTPRPHHAQRIAHAGLVEVLVREPQIGGAASRPLLGEAGQEHNYRVIRGH